MPSTYSPLLRIQLIATGEQSGTWGATTNTNLGTLIEEAIAGSAIVSVTSGNVTLTEVDGLTDQSRCAAIRVTGTPGVSRNIVAPAVSHIYVVANGSNAAVVLKTSSSTGLTIPTGQVYLAYYDSVSADFRMVGQAVASTNTANTLVLRDASGNFAANVITATGITNTGNTTLGDNSSDTLTVNATPTFNVAVPAASGGTGQSSYAVGDILFASTSSALSKLADVATGNALISGGVGVAPTYGKIGLTTHVSGTLPVANGGTGVTTSTGTGSVVLSASPTFTGTPVAPTAAPGTNTTQIATTAFVTNVAGSLGTISSQNANNVAITGGTIDNVTTSGSSTAAASGLGYLGIPQNGKSSGYTLALADAGKHIYYTGGAATLVVPTNASVAFPVGTTITLINNGSGSLTISTTSITMNFAGTTSTGNRTLATKGMATIIKVATDGWFISGVGLS